MQLILTIIAAVILTFSVTFSSLGQRTEGAVGLYITAVGLCMAFLSVFWSFGSVSLERLLMMTFFFLLLNGDFLVCDERFLQESNE